MADADGAGFGDTLGGFLLRMRRPGAVAVTAAVGVEQALDASADSGGAFFVDPERAAACVAVVREVARRLDDARPLMWQAKLVDAPGEDPVSVNMAGQARIMAERALAFAMTWQAQLHAAADGLERQLRDYQRADHTAAELA